jgi:hypothetical protein
MDYNTSFWKTLRWIGVLPCAIIACVVSYLIVQYVYSFLQDSDSWAVLYVIPIICSCLSGAIFILAGVYIAPSYRSNVAGVLLIIALLLAGATIYVDILHRDYFELIKLIASMLGSILAYVLDKEGVIFKTKN